MDGHFSNILCFIKNGEKSDSCAAHFEQYFKSTMEHTDLRKCMMFKVVNHINPIGAMKKIKKPNCNLCMEECLNILNKILDKCITIMNNNSETYRTCQRKTIFHKFCLSTYDPV